MLKIAAIYARVSSVKQKESETIESQIAALLKFAENQGYTVPNEWIFRDEGYSGSLIRRPGLDAVRELAHQGELNAVLVYSPDRLSRKFSFQMFLEMDFQKAGTDLLFFNTPQATTPEEQLSLHFKGIFAEYERTQITERCRRGRNFRAKLGNVSVISNAPYGYVYRKRNPPENAAYVIDDIKAEIVRKIYRWYVLEGKSIRRMALELDENGIEPPRGGQKWHNSTVRDILRNHAYTGIAYFGKSENNEGFSDKIIYTKSGKKKCPPKSRKLRDKEAWTEILVPAIIDKTEFELAQRQLDRNKQLSSRNTRQPSLLQGVLICGNCGHPYYRKVRCSVNSSYNYYACGDRLNGGVCKNRSFKQNELDDAIWNHVIELMRNPSLIEEEIRNRTLESNEKKHTAIKRRDIEKELLRLDKAKDKLLEAYQYGECLTIEELQRRVKAMEKQRILYENELKSMQAQLLQEENCIVLKENMKHFLESLERSNKLSMQEKQKVIRLLVDEIKLSKGNIEITHCIPISSDSVDFSQNVLLRSNDFNNSP